MAGGGNGGEVVLSVPGSSHEGKDSVTQRIPQRRQIGTPTQDSQLVIGTPKRALVGVGAKVTTLGRGKGKRIFCHGIVLAVVSVVYEYVEEIECRRD